MTQNTLTKGNSLQNGKYKIERVLGQGAFGITYQAKHTMLNMPVAIKELFLSDPQKYCTRDASDKTVNPNFDIDEFEKFKERFLDEATTLARFKDCHNIVNVSDIFSENATVYFVMDYIEGQSLTQSVKEQNGQLLLETAANYIKQIASALDFIHNKNILHRDIKPDNILIKPDGTAVLIDFGIARSYTDGKTSLQTTFHTPGYSPPEQKVANAKRGAYTDIFALGGTFYFCLTGRPPQTMDDININGFISVKDINPQIPENINILITKSIQQRRESRQQSIAEFISDLGSIKNDNNKEITETQFINEVENNNTNEVSEKTIIKNEQTIIEQDSYPSHNNTFTDNEGNTYKTIKIGNQIWMAENLNLDVGDGCWCYDNDPVNCEKYGRLYTWEAAKRAADKIPGWHLPTDEEWKQLEDFLGGNENAGDKMKSTNGWNNGGNGNDSSGFSAMPGGYHNLGYFYNVGYCANYWSATAFHSGDAWTCKLSCNNSEVHRYNYYEDKGCSVRLVKD